MPLEKKTLGSIIYLFILFLHTYMFPACCFHQRTYMAQGDVNGALNETQSLSYVLFF